jgi:DNA-binding winged helix-turn-helix (wHTH) protein
VKAKPANSAIECFGPFEFDTQTGELRKQGIRIHLEGQPLVILRMLLERPGEVVSRDEIRNKLWPADTFVDFEHSLNAAIKRLRRALNDSASVPRYIETLSGRGYRVIASVRMNSPEQPEKVAVRTRPRTSKKVWLISASAVAAFC